MFFIVDKPRLQRMIALARDDRTPADRKGGGPFFRIEASGGQVKLTGSQMEVEFPATVYQEGVLFLRVTLFRKALRTVTNTPTIAIQVSPQGLHFDVFTLKMGGPDMLYYADAATAPAVHPGDRST